MPRELERVADEIFVTLPSGSLMRGILLGDEMLVGGIASLGRKGAKMKIVLNTRHFDDSVPHEARGLPDVTPLYTRDIIAAAFAAKGVRIDKARWMETDEVAEFRDAGFGVAAAVRVRD